MKNLLFLLLLTAPLTALCQIDTASIDFPYKDGVIIYEITKEVPNVPKNTIYASSKKWIADSFKSSKAVIQSEDISSGQIIGKATTYAQYIKPGAIFGVGMTISLSFQIDCRDNKYRIRFYDLGKYEATGMLAGTSTPMEEFDKTQTKKRKTERWGKLIKIINNHIYSLTIDFENNINKSKADTF